MNSSPFALWHFWLLAAFGMGAAAVVGFACGVYYERTSLTRLARTVRRRAARAVDQLTRQLQQLTELCRALEKATAVDRLAQRLDELERRRDELTRALTATLDRLKARAAALPKPTPPRGRSVRRRAVRWRQPPAPDNGDYTEVLQTARSNLQLLLESGPHAQAGLLLVQVDRLPLLRRRYGPHAEALAEKVGQLVAARLNPYDFFCRVADDTFLALLPDVDVETGTDRAARVRRAIRDYRFRLNGDSGPEVLVTASLAYVQCRHGEPPDVALSRAQEGLARSQRYGRNQLHTFDGHQFVRCLTP